MRITGVSFLSDNRMDDMNTTDTYVHLSPIDVDCWSCDADAGQPCAEPRFGQEGILTDHHHTRIEAAEQHVVDNWRHAPDSDIIVGVCTSCGEEVDR